jgi:predicted RNA-binding Zn-ribbon protein involved in translation (DUF1610 family)
VACNIDVEQVPESAIVFVERWNSEEAEVGDILEEARSARHQVSPRCGAVSIARGALRRRQGAANDVPAGCPCRLEGPL